MYLRLLLSIFLFLGIFHSYCDASTTNSNIVINEIQINGGTGKSNDDFIELYNPTANPIDITNWKLEKIIKSGTKSVLKNFTAYPNQKIIIPAQGYLLWTCSAGSFVQLTKEEFTSSGILSNDYSLGLFDKDAKLVDALTYGSGHALIYTPSILYLDNPPANTSLQRNLENNLFLLQNQPTPLNTAIIEEEIIEDENDEIINPPIIQKELPLKINEIFPNPLEKGEENEFIEIFNFGNSSIDISNFILKDASKSGAYIFPPKSAIGSNEYLVVYKKDSKISLNNSDEKVYLLDSNNSLIDSVEYVDTKEGSSFGFDKIENKFRWSKNLTPGEINIFDPAPEGKEKIPKKSYKNFPTEFSASGSSNYDYSWDFGDGAKSTKQKTTHTYKKTGKFNGFLIINNGTEEKKIDFEIKIEKYPKKSIDIIGILPNPEGSDSDNEYIILKNNDKKSIDLSSWSIATGSNKNKLTNHPFTKSITIKKGEAKIIYNKYSNFSLPNQKGFIELRQPDGKTSDKTSYNKEKSIDENELYQLSSDKKWSWTNQPLTAKDEMEKEEIKEIKFEDLSDEEKEKITQEIKERLREEVYAELTGELEKKSEENQSVLGEEKTDDKVEEKDNFIIEVKKSLKNIFLETSLYFENLFK